ncbi:MAG: hypothetical protein ACRECV_18965 [Xanthobacteraceae bacterium]
MIVSPDVMVSGLRTVIVAHLPAADSRFVSAPGQI